MSQELITIHRRNLDLMLPEFSKVLMHGLPAERIARCVMNALQANPKLAAATPQSVLNAAMTSAVLNLEVDNVTGQGYIVPFKTQAQFIPGYKGYITLAARAGYLLEGSLVRERDDFDEIRGSNPGIIHKPAKGGEEERGPIIGAYAVARSNSLPQVHRYLALSDIIRIRDNSPGWKAHLKWNTDSLWASNPAAMIFKTPIRLLGSQLPMSFQIAAAIEGAYERGLPAYTTSLDPSGLRVGDEDQTSPKAKKTDEQPPLVDADGKPIKDAEFSEEGQCPTCHGRKVVEDASGKGPCPNCGGKP